MDDYSLLEDAAMYLPQDKRDLIMALASSDVDVHANESEMGTVYTVERVQMDQGRDNGYDDMGKIGVAR